MKVITDIQTQKRNPNRVSIFVNHVFYIGISLYICKKYKLTIGMEFNEEKFGDILKEENFEEGKIYATKYLMGRPEKVIREKMLQKEYATDTIDRVVTFMKHYNFSNDENFAFAFAHDASRIKEQGIRKIEHSLKSKGIGSQTIQKALLQISDEEQINAATHKLSLKIDSYKKKAKNEYELKSKCYAYLTRQGFERDIIQIVIEELIE